MIFEGDVTASGCSAIGQIVYDRPSPGQPRAPPATPCETAPPPPPNPPAARRPTPRPTLPPRAAPPHAKPSHHTPTPHAGAKGTDVKGEGCSSGRWEIFRSANANG